MAAQAPKTVVKVLFPQQSGVLPVLHCILKSLYVLLAEDGLLGDDEMSQLSGKTLDLRNSAALLKMARMSVDATALEDSEYLYHCNPRQYTNCDLCGVHSYSGNIQLCFPMFPLKEQLPALPALNRA